LKIFVLKMKSSALEIWWAKNIIQRIKNTF